MKEEQLALNFDTMPYGPINMANENYPETTVLILLAIAKIFVLSMLVTHQAKFPKKHVTNKVYIA